MESSKKKSYSRTGTEGKVDEMDKIIVLNPSYPELEPVFIYETPVKAMITAAISQADNYHLYKSMALAGIVHGGYKDKADYRKKELTMTLYGRLVDLLFLNRKQPNALENGLAALSALFSV